LDRSCQLYTAAVLSLVNIKEVEKRGNVRHYIYYEKGDDGYFTGYKGSQAKPARPSKDRLQRSESIGKCSILKLDSGSSFKFLLLSI
jgi:hypothetical protein